MPEITAIHIAIVAAAVLVGVILGWLVRGNIAKHEKSAMNQTWQTQLEGQRSEGERLLEQNKSLMEQNSQYQASNRDSKMRASELSGALKEAFERRDELQRQIKDIRGNLESAEIEREQLQSDMQNRAAADDATSAALQQRDELIEKLNRELESWQDRVPPLIERFRERNEAARQLEEELAAAQERVSALEDMVGSDQTRVEPVDAEAMKDAMEASNEPIDVIDENTEAVEEATDDEDADELLAADELEEMLEPDDPEIDDETDADSEDHDAAQPAAVSDIQVARATTIDVGNTDNRDDLKQIKGVGPAIEKTLNEMGICRFDQIAEMGEYEIDRIANKLKGFRSRIYREDWIGQARDLQDQKSSNQA